MGRVNTVKVFEEVGMDLAGPLILRNGDKVWIVLFTCAVYRCIHLELVPSLSTDAFVNAFSRFEGRRGRPKTVYCDNGTNFVGASRALLELNWRKLAKKYAVEKIIWRFNPPAAPWWGGFWERMVRSLKELLRRTLKKTRLDFEKMSTCLVEIEATINGRPLTVVTEDSNDLIPLTPSMFLHDLNYAGISTRELLDEGDYRKLLSKKKTALEQFKTRFRSEYLGLLIQRGKKKNIREFQVGDVVLVGSDDKKRLQWPMAIIEKLFPGTDGHTRVATVRLGAGRYLTRPLQWIIPMELSATTDIPPMPEHRGIEEDVEVVAAQRDDFQVKGGESELEIKTRNGRVIKKPIRYEP